jgi:protein-tyrosine phosphatase
VNSIYWVGEDSQTARVAIVARPRGDNRLRDDLAEMKDSGIDVLVSFLPYEEACDLGLQDEANVAGELGLEFISYPIPDRAVPGDVAGFRDLVRQLADDVRVGKTVGAHCFGCIGRSTVLIASLMIALGYDAEDALRRIERARGYKVPDTPEQREWILQFEPKQ